MTGRKTLQSILILAALALFVLAMVPGEARAFQAQAGRQLSGPSQAPASPQAPSDRPTGINIDWHGTAPSTIALELLLPHKNNQITFGH